MIGTHADNEDLADGDAGFAARWNARYAYPRIRVSTMEEYLATVRPLADRLPVWRGDGGSYWEDGVGTGAAVTAEHRRVQSLLPTAEGLAALVRLVDPVYRPNRAALDAAWEGALYGCEHTWTWAHGTAHPHGHQVDDQLDWKRHQVHGAYRGALDEVRRALSQLGELVSTDGPTLLVHNPLGWRRDIEVLVETVRADPVGPDGPLPVEVLAECNGLRTLRVTVPDVPAFGYRALPMDAARTLSPGEEAGTPASDPAAVEPGPAAVDSADGWRPVPSSLVTARWEVTLDPRTGAVRGLRHRATGRDLLDSTQWTLGQVLYVLDGPETVTRGDGGAVSAAGDGIEHSGRPHHHAPYPRSTLLGRRPDQNLPELTVLPATMRPVGLRRTYDGWRLRTVGDAPSLPRIEVDVLLRDTDDRVDVLVDLDKRRVLAKESVYVAFPFAAADPSFRYDRQQGWIDPASDHAPGACHDWFTTGYGVLVQDGVDGPAVAWTSAHAPLFTAGDIVRGHWHERFTPAGGAVFSWVLNNYWPTNTPPEQDGRLRLRYAFTPLPTPDLVAAGRFGREVRAALAVSEVNRLDKFDTAPRPLHRPAGSLLDLGLPEHVQASVAPARAGTGLLVRLQDLSGRASEFSVRHPAGPDAPAAWCHADERVIAPCPADPSGAVPVRLGAWQVASLILYPSTGPSRPRPPPHQIGAWTMTDNRLNRRRFLTMAGGAAVTLAGGGALAGCGDATSTSAPDGAKSAVLPDYVPSQLVRPDLPPTPEGVMAGYYRYPRQLVDAFDVKPAAGLGDVRILTNMFNPVPPAAGSNQYWQELNNRVGANLDITMTPSADYLNKLSTTIASGDLPDIMLISARLARRADVLTRLCADLSEFLSGPAAANFPFLANIPRDSWLSTAYGGGSSRCRSPGRWWGRSCSAGPT
ncbi:hypothetical protein Jiend_10200 [Micromonospora endophytica]|uniref:hypothetical protein n=1 Tax=Micromonospora endophytica TaxID=515350 RepID=UPI001BB373F4|nr:hypothetical protein [Micromonospora endophytica]BCJ57598.1 hypothetical protein Jiend_10200 [Micromonospora endophytica]